jgi:glycoside hydrolase-like protein
MVALAAAALGSGTAALARPADPVRSIRYHGQLIRVPSSWPVYDLARNPTICVRFDRPAVYLGTPGRTQRCPAHAAGRHRAILIEPGPKSARVLHAPLLAQVRASRSVRARPAQVGGVYTGPGFDACSAPSTSAMSAWGSTTYRGIGVYIGGANMACSQANLTSSWISTETGAGWHLIPTYVGLQAPSNSCGCQAIVASKAQAEGTAAANDAVAHAQSLGLGPGNPIYFDMEAYSTGGSSTSAVLAFLSAWTAQLHADSYLSGVYSSGASGIRDLVAQVGTGYLEPDDLWIADWNGQQSASDPYVPSGDWSGHQRIHQYKGGHNETHGGVTINIDSDYLDGATAGAGGGTTGSRPSNTAAPSIGGVPTFGNTLVASPGAWSGTSPISYSYRWQRCSSGCRNIAGATSATHKLVGADIGTRVRVRVSASNTAGHTQVASTAIGPVAPIGYWLFTGAGNVYGSVGTRGFGSPAAKHARRPAVVGMAATPDGGGYWLAGASGQIWAFGDAAHLGWSPRRQPVRGIVADPLGGYWLFTASGNVYRAGGAGWFGSPAVNHAKRPAIVGMAATSDGEGYWLVGASGRVWAYGDAGRLPALRHSHPIAGIAGP